MKIHGYWTQAIEEWFQQRRDKIVNGEAHPHTASEWRDLLRKRRPLLHAILDSAAKLAAESLPNVELPE